MKLTFRIQYRTVWGEDIRVILNDDTEHPIALSTRDGNNWIGTTNYEAPVACVQVTYRYGVFCNGVCVRKEFGAIPHSFDIGNAQQTHYIMDDCWRDLPAASYKYSSAFNEPHPCVKPNQLNNHVGNCITFRALCPELYNKKQELGIIGSSNALGNWEYCRPLRMYEVQPNVWHITLDASSLTFPFEYKFAAINAKTGAVEEWESGPNRTFHIQPLLRGETYLPMESEVFFNLPATKIAGTAIPVFSLRSEGSFGVGDFGDLLTFIEWAAQTHQKAVQILPINDTTMTGTWTDSYPYSSISIYAFHPMFTDLRQLPALKDKEAAARFEKERIRLNALPQVDYEEVNLHKRNYLKAIFKQEKEAILSSKDFQQFFADNKNWLLPYAAFCFLREKYGTPEFTTWPEYADYQKEEIEALCNPGSESYEDIAYHYFVQYSLHVQLLKACDYGRSKGVIVKGDIPIGISRTSVEAWTEPYYFNMNGQAGAPPDAFSTKGQNWGLPTYNWEVMEKDNYQWWRLRFSKMAEYFTAYRIDHILGFFRIWEIPTHSVHGLLGQFSPALPMSPEEIRSFGLDFNKEFMTQPFINEYMLQTMFGDKINYVKENFVVHRHHDIYAMRPEFDTQRKVEAFFAGKTDVDSLNLKEGLYALISNVLFVPDRKNPDMYHPRIAVQNDYIFNRLTWNEKEAFNRLYNHYYYQRHNEFWYSEAMKKLPILTQSTPMLVCGEDLGMVPDCVPWVMDQLQILSLEIQRMPKDPKCEFGHVYAYPLRSVCTIGTHDMSTLRGWWEEDATVTEHFYHSELGHWGDVPKQAPGWLCKEVIEHHLKSPSMLCILTWQDWTAMDEELRNPNVDSERINIPANPRHYWRWRMHITLERLMKQTEFNEEIIRMIDESGRY
ncbi:4-alpha-glucanotransferase [Phocaeicola barnesiae]|uniref:4-alpha-glucanotransferase n=1 Tax=Phocaeicola barnesiae TaxID=376804 RepID=UPI001D363C97|nr:4-alpha-glucanotransferase [Phocaeicola barnesiae]HJG77920.1 4-alpha-glucanotransferase [Phocaeicola barnesiae]